MTGSYCAPWVSSTNIDSKGTGATTDLHANTLTGTQKRAGEPKKRVTTGAKEKEGRGARMGRQTGVTTVVYILRAPAVESGTKQRGGLRRE
jgi:hypothetical protein